MQDRPPGSTPPASAAGTGGSKNTFSPAGVRSTRIAVVAVVVAILLLVFAVPRATPPPPSLAQPSEAFVDRAGLVSPAFAHDWAVRLLVDSRADIVVYIDADAPPGLTAMPMTHMASAWRIGAAKRDTGAVLFVFVRPRIARMEVGYGLEPTFTDARMRQLLEEHLVPAFAAGEYEKGLDRLLVALRKELGGDVTPEPVDWSRHTVAQFVAASIERAPRVVHGAWRAYIEGGTEERIAIIIAVTVFAIVTGIALAGMSAGLMSIVLYAGPELLRRQGEFSGAGAGVIWPAPSR